MKVDIGKVASLAHLDLTESESKKYAKDLEDILTAFKTLDKLDTSGVKPAFHPIPIKNTLREDIPEDPKLDPFSNTDLNEDGYFKGPKIQ